MNTMQLEAPGVNHSCLMVIGYVNDVQNKRLVDSFFNIKFNMYLCIFTATVITVYKHDKQKTTVYKSDQFKMEKSKKWDILLS